MENIFVFSCNPINTYIYTSIPSEPVNDTCADRLYKRRTLVRYVSSNIL